MPASGSGDPGAPDTPHPRRPRRLGPRLRHRPEVRGTSRKDGWQSQDPSAPSHPGKTPNGPQAQAHQPRAQPRWPENAQQLTGPTPTEPPSHRAILPFHRPIMAGECRRPLSQTRHDQWCKGRPPAASDAANHEAPLSMSCVGARQQVPSCLGNLPSESLPLASIPACFLQHRTGCRSGCSPGAGTARCAVG